MTYFLAPCLVKLRSEVDERWPKRDKASDGWIGDPAHRSRVSDHNPDERGCVHALDVDADGIDTSLLLKQVIGDPRVWYVIHDRRIYSRTYGWAARAYTGTNPHTTHVHVSIRYERRFENDTATWLGPTRSDRTKGGRLPLVDLGNVWRQIDHHQHPLLGIRRIQRSLNRRYGAQLKVDGWWGPRTERAYLRHERAINAPEQDGRPGRWSLTELGRGRFRVRA